MAAPSYPDTISGKYLVAKIGSTTISGVMDWSATETVDELDGATGESEGYDYPDQGLRRVEADFNLIQNLATGVYSDVAAGVVINLKLYRSAGDTNPAFDITDFLVLSSATRGAVRERFTVAVRGKSRGSYTRNDPGA
jgi:hypothetical protein